MRPLPTVKIYDDNAGAGAPAKPWAAYLHAENGAVYYEGNIDPIHHEAIHVAQHPDGDTSNWAPELQHTWTGEEPGDHIATILPPRIYLKEHARIGTEGGKYLGFHANQIAEEEGE